MNVIKESKCTEILLHACIISTGYIVSFCYKPTSLFYKHITVAIDLLHLGQFWESGNSTITVAIDLLHLGQYWESDNSTFYSNVFLKGYPLEAKIAPKKLKLEYAYFLASFSHLVLISDP